MHILLRSLSLLVMAAACTCRSQTDNLRENGGAESKLNQGNTVSKPAVLEGVKRILFYGDSLTDGSSYPDYVVNALNGRYPDAGFRILNSANCGNTTKDLLNRFQADVLDRHPDLVVICIGANDCNTKLPLQSYRDNLEKMLSALDERKVKVILMLTSPFADTEKEARLQGYLDIIKELSGKHHTALSDAHAEFQKGIAAGREMLGPDGLHHGRNGFEGMARAVLDALALPDLKPDMTVRPWPGLLTIWQVSEPISIEQELNPANASGWKDYDAKAISAQADWYNADFPSRGAFMPFKEGPRKGFAAYGRTYFNATEAGDYVLSVGGSPNPQTVWLNGVKVWERKDAHGFHPDSDTLKVHMEKGRNEIVVASNFFIFIGLERN